MRTNNLFLTDISERHGRKPMDEAIKKCRRRRTSKDKNTTGSLPCACRVSLWIFTLVSIIALNGCATIGGHLDQAQSHLRQGQYDAAITAYYRAAEADPSNSDVQLGLADVFNKKGLKGQAIQAWEKALSLSPNNQVAKQQLVEAYAEQGQTYRQAGKVSDAYESWKKALTLDPDHMKTNGLLAQLYSDQGEDDKAALQYQKLTSHQPHDKDAHQALGLVYYKQGKLDQAIQAFQQVLRLNPKNAQAFNNLGIAYLKTGQLDDAITAFEQAAGINPNLVVTYNNWGTALFQQGRYLKAREQWELSLRLDATNQIAQKNLDALDTLGY